jgi:hypothetical protein
MLPCLSTNWTFTVKWIVIPTQETSNMATFLNRVQCDPMALIQVVKTTQSIGGERNKHGPSGLLDKREISALQSLSQITAFIPHQNQ